MRKKSQDAFSLPKDFTSLVDWSVSILGQVIEEKLGRSAFEEIEEIRQYVKSLSQEKGDGLQKLKENFEKFNPPKQYSIAHSFALMLELINCCESAFRTHRIAIEKTGLVDKTNSDQEQKIIVEVLTAHPTESRNSSAIFFFEKIQKLLFERLQGPEFSQAGALRSFLERLWHLPISKHRKPTVLDEAEYIYSLALKPEIIDLLIKNEQASRPFFVRTWVGGDKDGNPLVDEKTLIASLEKSRAFILKYFILEIENCLREMRHLASSHSIRQDRLQILIRIFKKIKVQVTLLRVIRSGDANRIYRLKNNIKRASQKQIVLFGSESDSFNKIQSLLKVFPGLVLPLEIREDSTLVRTALEFPRKKLNISRMLAVLGKLCTAHNPQYYVRGFVISQCSSVKDIESGIQLTKKFCRGQLPVIPLFESADSLENSAHIVQVFLSQNTNLNLVKKRWNSQFEVMLGYSDSAKENGVWSSRFLIQSAMYKLEKVINKNKLQPVFFHGSGGSIERGGGSIQEQAEWWPLSALDIVKMTVQGEMVYRNFSSPFILQRQLNLLEQLQRKETSQKRDNSKTGRRDQHFPTKNQSKNEEYIHDNLQKLSDNLRQAYQSLIQDPEFLLLIEQATPYLFLKNLRFGSRPTQRPNQRKRSQQLSLHGLRAIPWVLCWTQTRILFPTWWGIGSFWRGLSKDQKKEFQKVYLNSSIFRSYIKALGFTLKKVDLEIFFLYLNSSHLEKSRVQKFKNLFFGEYHLALTCIHEMTNEKSLLWFRPWLETSIDLRSPLIHPLNVMQVIALENKDVTLLRECVTGIASGMLTTG